MDEKYLILLLSLLMILFSSLFAYWLNGLNFSTGFNFYSSTLTINGTKVTEVLHFLPDQQYHTLFRNFTNVLASSGSDTISILNVSCQNGTPYYRTYQACYTFQNNQIVNACLNNTEDNEYGCTFGSYRGFNIGTDYWINASYLLNPANLFLVNGKYYIKFIAYSAYRHPYLKIGQNFFVDGGITQNTYNISKNVVIYIPYNGSIAGFHVMNESNFMFPGFNYAKYIYDFILFLLPVIVFDAIWLAFVKQKLEPPVPKEIMNIPNDKRKPWEVSAYFVPPFSGTGKTFYPTLMLDFYRRKIIDIKYVDKGIFNRKTLIKILNDQKNKLDNVESEYLDILKKLDKNCPDDGRVDGYFDIYKALKNQSIFDDIRVSFNNILGFVKDEGEKFISLKGIYLFGALTALMFFGSAFLNILPLFISSVIFAIIVFAIHLKMPLLLRYNGDYYEEYKEWSAFRNSIIHMFSIKNSKSDAVVLWDVFLVYATSLGVADKVLKQLKKSNFVDKKKLNVYSGVYIGITNFHTAMYASRSGGFAGGGFGGGGFGGGMGGGGGGGR